MQWVSCASSRLTVWLQGLKVRDLSSTPVSRAILETSCSGIRLQTCRKRLNRQRVGLMLFLFFIPAVWQVQIVKPTLFSFSVGWLWIEFIMAQPLVQTVGKQSILDAVSNDRDACRSLGKISW